MSFSLPLQNIRRFIRVLRKWDQDSPQEMTRMIKRRLFKEARENKNTKDPRAMRRLIDETRYLEMLTTNSYSQQYPVRALPDLNAEKA